MKKVTNDTIVALFKDKNDFLIARDRHWYRIPTRSRVPEILKDGSAKYISFYFKKEFGDWKYSIRHYAEIYDVQQVRRCDLMPHQPYHPQANALYYKISFEPLRDLPKPIVSQRGRIVVFIPTTLQKLFLANEFNDIFSDSPLEEKLWLELKKSNLPAERQFFLKTNENSWICDFAFFCKTGTIDVECDGDTYHMQPEQVIYEKNRNNQIAAVANWATLRFTTKHLVEEMPQTMLTIKRKIDKFGGLYYAQEDAFKYVSRDDQMRLFD